MVKIQYFASLRETLGAQNEELALPAEVQNVEQLARHLSHDRAGECRDASPHRQGGAGTGAS